MKKIYAHLLAFALLLVNLTVMAQSKPISGTVVSVADGTPIPGATILVKGTNRATTTDLDGNFKRKILDSPHKETSIFYATVY